MPTRILNAYEERGLSFSQGYGMTETSPGATSLSPRMTREKQGSVGLPHFFTDVRIADEHGAMVPRGTVGEIEISGPNVFPGYHGLPEATAEAFTADGWFRSGDLGYLDADGYLYIADRLKDMIISGGENIYPAEIENLINDIDGVTGVAVIGVPDERWGEVPWAIVTVADGRRRRHRDRARAPRRQDRALQDARRTSSSSTSCRAPPRARCARPTCAPASGRSSPSSADERGELPHGREGELAVALGEQLERAVRGPVVAHELPRQPRVGAQQREPVRDEHRARGERAGEIGCRILTLPVRR